MSHAKPILAVGAANAERVLKVPRVEPGTKSVIPPAMMAAGGSAVNHTCRLLAAGVPARPIVPLGDDYPSGLVRQVILAAAATGAASSELQHELNGWFRRVERAGEATAYSTILVEPNGRRTTFSETASASAHFRELCGALVKEIPVSQTAGLIVGHIHADAVPSPDVPYGCSGQITSNLLNDFHGKVPVVVNLGRSQYRLGANHWLTDIRKADVYQATHDEAVELITVNDPEARSLRAVARWFQDNRITAVVTVDKLGAIGIMKDDSRVALAWPFELGDEVVDSTGAGDAMAAGLIAWLSGRNGSTSFGVEQLRDALAEATVWAAYACTTFGGAADCPSRAALDRFAREKAPKQEVEVVPIDHPHAERFFLFNEHYKPTSYASRSAEGVFF